MPLILYSIIRCRETALSSVEKYTTSPGVTLLGWYYSRNCGFLAVHVHAVASYNAVLACRQQGSTASQKKGLTYFSLTDVSTCNSGRTSRIQSSSLQACALLYPSNPPTVMQRIGVCSGVNHTISSNTFL